MAKINCCEFKKNDYVMINSEIRDIPLSSKPKYIFRDFRTDGCVLCKMYRLGGETD